MRLSVFVFLAFCILLMICSDFSALINKEGLMKFLKALVVLMMILVTPAVIISENKLYRYTTLDEKQGLTYDCDVEHGFCRLNGHNQKVKNIIIVKKQSFFR